MYLHTEPAGESGKSTEAHKVRSPSLEGASNIDGQGYNAPFNFDWIFIEIEEFYI